jgi:hypothetical protein
MIAISFTVISYDYVLQLVLQEVNEDDERALEMFMNHNPAPRQTLADIILEKITEKQTELQTQFSDAGSECLFILKLHMDVYKDYYNVLLQNKLTIQ